MTGKTHVACGVLSAVAFTAVTGLYFKVGNAYSSGIACALLSATGSLLPDIDMPHSRMGRKHPIISSWFKHRGMTHTFIFPALLFLICVISSMVKNTILATILFNIVFPCMFGWIIHIWADLFNEKGCPIFFPFTYKHIHIASFLTRSWQEYIFLALYFVATLAVVYTRVMPLL